MEIIYKILKLKTMLMVQNMKEKVNLIFFVILNIYFFTFKIKFLTIKEMEKEYTISIKIKNKKINNNNKKFKKLNIFL
jgi:hypothetical protein